MATTTATTRREVHRVLFGNDNVLRVKPTVGDLIPDAASIFFDHFEGGEYDLPEIEQRLFCCTHELADLVEGIKPKLDPVETHKVVHSFILHLLGMSSFWGILSQFGITGNEDFTADFE
jgi:hypothetical protein